MRKKILLHLIATGKYDMYLDNLIESAKNYFLNGQDVRFIIYTNSERYLNLSDPNIFTFKIEHEPWPGPTLKRFHYFTLSSELIRDSDFSFYIDVDSSFRRKIDLEILGIDRDLNGTVGTLHPGFYGTVGTPERRPSSLAYIPQNLQNSYFCGGFFGGSSDQFLKLSEKIKNNIDSDLSRGLIAIWHDESHLNRYFLDNPPEFILGVGFSCPEELLFSEINFMDPFIVFLDKDPLLKMDKINYQP